MIKELLSNLSILLVLSAILSYFKGLNSPIKIRNGYSTGILFGLVTIVGMNFPLTLDQGLIFDGRSVILSISAFFYGPISAIIAAVIAGIYRVHIGGSGLTMGLSVIFSSAAIGVFFYYLRLRGVVEKKILTFVILSFSVHIVMLFLMLLLPVEISKSVFTRIAPLIIIIYIPFTVILGFLIREQEQKIIEHNLLIESEERYRSLFENASFGIYRTNPKGQILLANPALIGMLGYNSLDELRERNLESNGFETLEHRQDFKKQIEEKGVLKGVETVWKGKDNQTIYVVECAKAFRNKNGEVIYYEGIVEDITHIRLTEKALSDNEMLFKSLVEEVPVGIFRTDKNGSTTYVNPKWSEISGIQFHEALGNNWLKAVHPDDVETVMQGWKQAIANNEFSTADYRFLWKDGTVKWISGKAAPQKDSEGSVIGYIGTAVDITERKQYEEKLMESEEKFRKLIEQAPIGFVLSDSEQRTLFTNKKFVELTGYTIEDHPTVEEWWPKAYPDEEYRELIKKEWIDSITASINSGTEIKPMECRVTCKDGSVKYLQIGFVSAGYFNIVSVVDITERKNVEEELLLLKEKLEEKVAEQTLELNQKISELENFKEITLNREYRIMELRKELNELKRLNRE